MAQFITRSNNAVSDFWKTTKAHKSQKAEKPDSAAEEGKDGWQEYAAPEDTISNLTIKKLVNWMRSGLGKGKLCTPLSHTLLTVSRRQIR